MEIEHKDYCSSCRTGTPDIRYNKSKYKNRFVQYYHCRDCNNKRARKYYAENPERCRKIIAKSIKKHRAKQDCREETNKAIRKGDLIRPNECSSCKERKDIIQAHHEDYAKPLDVIWVCPPCHSVLDKKMRKN